MLVIGGFLLGALLGVASARRQGGRPADMAQYAAGFGILFALLGLLLTLIATRLV